MLVRNRAFGLAADEEPGGSTYDVIKAAPHNGVIPPPDEWWPVNEVTPDKGITNLENNDRVNGRRASDPPEPFRRNPAASVTCDAFFELLARALFWAYGLPNARTGVAPAALTDLLKPIPYGSASTPKFRHMTLVRDELIYRYSGAMINNLAVNLPFDGNGTFTTEWLALFMQQRPAGEDQGTPDFGDIKPVTLKIRDVGVYMDGGVVKVPDVEAVSFNFGNQAIHKPYSGHNVVPDPDDPCFKLWFPAEIRLGAGQDVGYGLTLGKTDAAEEFKQDFARAQKLVFELEECPMPTVPPAVRIIRHTIAAGVHTGGGAGNLTKGDDITSAFTGSGHHSDADGLDIKTEVVHNTTDLLADPA